MRISDILEAASTKTVTIGGKTFTLHELTSGQGEAIDRAFPRPEPPKKYNPLAGSAAPPTPDIDDPVFVEAHRAWYPTFSRVEIAVAIGLEPAGVPALSAAPTVDAMKAWGEAAARELATVPEGVLAQLVKALRAMAEDINEGNSSSPPTAP